MGRLSGKVALVTGGGSGIGAATCHLFAKEGAKVVVSDIDKQAGEAVAAAVAEQRGEACFQSLDVGEEAQWVEAVAAATARFGALDVLVNNAGVDLTGNVEQATLEDWRLTQRVNVEGVFLGTKHAIAVMRERGGSIVNISSVAGIQGEAMQAAYCASKGAVRLFTKSAAVHCTRSGYKIRINSVHPGGVVTPMLKTIAEQMVAAGVGDMSDVLGAIPMGRLAAPDEIAYGILYLACDESSYVTGSELVIDGGMTASL